MNNGSSSQEHDNEAMNHRSVLSMEGETVTKQDVKIKTKLKVQTDGEEELSQKKHRSYLNALVEVELEALVLDGPQSMRMCSNTCNDSNNKLEPFTVYNKPVLGLIDTIAFSATTVLGV